jgi:hypothetical protein
MSKPSSLHGTPPFAVRVVSAKAMPIHGKYGRENLNTGIGYYVDAYESAVYVINAEGEASDFSKTPPFGTVEEAETALLVAQLKGVAL